MLNVYSSRMSVFSFTPIPNLTFTLSADLSSRKIRVLAMAESVTDTSNSAQKYHVVRGASCECES